MNKKKTLRINLTRFTASQLFIISDLLKAYCDNIINSSHSIFSSGDVSLRVPDNELIHIQDSYGDKFMTQELGGKLERYYTCPYCDHRGFLEDMLHDSADHEDYREEAKEWMRSIGVKGV